MSILRCTVFQDLNGIAIDNIVGVRTTDSAGASEATAVATAVHNTWAGTILGVLSQELDLLHTDAVGVDDPTTFGTHVATFSGGVSGDLLPTFACVKVNVVTGLRGRAYRGRTGLGGLTEDMTLSLDGNTLKPATLTAIKNAVDSFYVTAQAALASIAGGSSLAVISETVGGVPRPTPISTDVTAMNTVAKLGTRRSRLT